MKIKHQGVEALYFFAFNNVHPVKDIIEMKTKWFIKKNERFALFKSKFWINLLVYGKNGIKGFHKTMKVFVSCFNCLIYFC